MAVATVQVAAVTYHCGDSPEEEALARRLVARERLLARNDPGAVRALGAPEDALVRQRRAHHHHPRIRGTLTRVRNVLYMSGGVGKRLRWGL